MPSNAAIKSQEILERLENSSARSIIKAYWKAYKDIGAEVAEAMTGLGPAPAIADVRRVSRNVALLNSIDARLRTLSSDIAIQTREALATSQGLALASAEAELRRIATLLDIDFDIFIGQFDEQLADLVDSIMLGVNGLSDSQRVGFAAELTTSLIRGDSFERLADRLFALEPSSSGVSFARRGANSIELLVRRVVIEANNASRQLIYERAETQIPGLKKQLIAAIQPGRTTETCLKAHGQVQDIGSPYRLVGSPRFSREIMYPPFHWRCRSSSVAYHAEAEKRSKLKTEDMKDDAKAVLDQNKETA